MKMQDSKWKAIQLNGQETNYLISDEGEVKNGYTGDIIKSHATGGRANHRYQRVHLKIGKGQKNYRYVHRLVANAFLDKAHPSLEVNHKDRNTSNNHVSNLEWISHKENLRFSMKDVNANIPPVDVAKMRILYSAGVAISSISHHFQIKRHFVTKIVRFKVHTGEKYIKAQNEFKFEDPSFI